jgi:hypothetical protein
MSAEFPTLAEVLTQHRWQMFNAVCRCKAMEVTHDEHPAHQAEMWREVCTIRTVAELDALPDDSVIRRGGFFPRTYEREGRYWHSPGDEMGDIAGPDMLPALLLWHPDWAQS